MWYYINLCGYTDVLYSAQSVLHLAQLKREGRQPVSFCTGFESVYINAVWGVSVETLRITASYSAVKEWVVCGVMPPLSTLLHLQQPSVPNTEHVKSAMYPSSGSIPLALLCWQPKEGLRAELQSVNVLYKCIKHTCWFCFSDTFVPRMSVAYRLIPSFPLSCCRTCVPHLTLPFSLKW